MPFLDLTQPRVEDCRRRLAVGLADDSYLENWLAEEFTRSDLVHCCLLLEKHPVVTRLSPLEGKQAS